MLIRSNSNGGRPVAARLTMVVPALLLLAPLSLAPIGAAAAVDGHEADCYNLEDECVPFSDITKDTRVFLAQGADGSTQGFTDWNAYEAYVEDQSGLDVELRNGNVVVLGDDDDGDDGDGDRDRNRTLGGRGAGKAGGVQSVSGGFGLFYEPQSFQGRAIAVGAPDFIPDLSKVRFGHNSSWNNRISAVSARAGGVALVCLRKNCAAGGPVLFITVPAGSDIQLAGGLNNAASAVGVF